MAHPLIENLTESTFDELISTSEVPVLVDFWAEWCGPCKAIAPILEEIADEQDGQLKIAKVDVDSNQQLALNHQVMSIPTLILFQDGEPSKRLVGAKSKRDLLADLADVITG